MNCPKGVRNIEPIADSTTPAGKFEAVARAANLANLGASSLIDLASTAVNAVAAATKAVSHLLIELNVDELVSGSVSAHPALKALYTLPDSHTFCGQTTKSLLHPCSPDYPSFTNLCELAKRLKPCLLNLKRVFFGHETGLSDSESLLELLGDYISRFSDASSDTPPGRINPVIHRVLDVTQALTKLGRIVPRLPELGPAVDAMNQLEKVLCGPDRRNALWHVPPYELQAGSVAIDSRDHFKNIWLRSRANIVDVPSMLQRHCSHSRKYNERSCHACQ